MTTAPRTEGYGMKVFLTILIGQMVSQIGSTMTGFALGVWVFLRTGSITEFALISMFTVLPSVVLSPVAGALIDRWDRRKVMLSCDTSAALCTLTLSILLMSGNLQVWHIYVIATLMSIFGAFQGPAFQASIPLLAPKDQLGRVNGLVMASYAIAQLASPLLAGVLVLAIEVQGVMIIDFLSFLVAVSTMLLVRIPRPEASEEGAQSKGSLLKEIAAGWRYVRTRPGLIGLLLLFLMTNFVGGLAQVLITPMVLSYTTTAALGTALSIGGFGMLAGSLAMGAWGGPQRRIRAMLGFIALEGLFIALAGLRPSIVLLAIGLFGFFFFLMMDDGCYVTVIHRKVAPDFQGRFFSLNHMVTKGSLPLAYLLAGPLADKVFEPLMRADGALAGSLGQVLGVGPGRGLGALFVLAGMITILAAGMAYLNPRVRLIEQELPDMIADQPESPPAEEELRTGEALPASA